MRKLPFVVLLVLAGCAAQEGPAPQPAATLPQPAVANSQMVLKYLRLPPTVDGDTDEPAWQDVEWRVLEHPFGSLPKSSDTYEVKLGWTYRGIYVAMRSTDSDIVADKLARDGPCWNGDSFEIFLDPAGRGVTYYEISVSPTSSFYDYFIIPRPGVNEPARITEWDMSGFRFAVKADAGGWRAEEFIPFYELATAPVLPPDAPWRGHIGVMDHDASGFTAANVFAITGAHQPASFGTLHFSAESLKDTLGLLDAGAARDALRQPPGRPVNLVAARVWSEQQGEFEMRDGARVAPQPYGQVQPLEAFVAEQRQAQRLPGDFPYDEFYRDLPAGLYLVHPADFKEPVRGLKNVPDATLISFRAGGSVSLFFRKSPATLPADWRARRTSSDVSGAWAATKGDGVGISLLAGGRCLMSRWTRSALWQAATIELGDEETAVTLSIDSGPATNDYDYVEVGVFVK